MKKDFDKLFLISLILLVIKMLSLDNYEAPTILSGFFDYIVVLLSLITLFTLLFQMRHNQEQFERLVKKDNYELSAMLNFNVSIVNNIATIEIWNLGKSPAYKVDVQLYFNPIDNPDKNKRFYAAPNPKLTNVIPPLECAYFYFIITGDDTPNLVNIQYYDLLNPSINNSEPLKKNNYIDWK